MDDQGVYNIQSYASVQNSELKKTKPAKKPKISRNMAKTLPKPLSKTV
jgi:hypothetical protein